MSSGRKLGKQWPQPKIEVSETGKLPCSDTSLMDLNLKVNQDDHLAINGTLKKNVYHINLDQITLQVHQQIEVVFTWVHDCTARLIVQLGWQDMRMIAPKKIKSKRTYTFEYQQ